MDIQKQVSGPKFQYSTDFVLISADWSLERIRRELNAPPKTVAIVERYTSAQMLSASYFIYPRWLLKFLLEGIKKIPPDESFLNDIKPLFETIGKPLNLTVSRVVDTSSRLDFHRLLSLPEQKGDYLVTQPQKNPDRPTVVVYSGGPRAYYIPESWLHLATVPDEQLSIISPAIAFPDSEPDFDPFSMEEKAAEGEPLESRFLSSEAPRRDIVRSLKSQITRLASIDSFPEAAIPPAPITKTLTPPVAPQRFLNAQTNDRVKLHEEFGLSVRVSAKALSANAGSGSTPLDGGATGRQIAGTISIDVYAPGFELLDGASKPLQVPESGDSLPIRFGLRALKQGLNTVHIDAWQGSAYIGAIEVNVAVDSAAAGDGCANANMLMREPEQGEYTLEIDYDDEEKVYTFRLRSEIIAYEPVKSKPLAGQSLDLYNSIISDMNAAARNIYQRGGTNLLTWLEGIGGDMFRTLIPAEIKTLLLDRSDKIKRLNIISRNDNLPWELLYLISDNGQEGRFLVDYATLSRHVYGRVLPQTLNKKTPYYILPQEAPTSAQSEFQRLQTKLGQGNTISDIDGLIRLLKTGGFGLAHFMAHNIQTPIPQTKPYIPFGDTQRFDLTYLGSIPDNKYLEDSPLVFVNACTSGGSKPLYTEMGGWATRFLQCGVGAYIGALWEVRDSSAANFAEAFYAELTSGKNLGESMAAGRSAVSRSDPTYFAYSLYGNPLAKLV